MMKVLEKDGKVTIKDKENILFLVSHYKKGKIDLMNYVYRLKSKRYHLVDEGNDQYRVKISDVGRVVGHALVEVVTPETEENHVDYRPENMAHGMGNCGVVSTAVVMGMEYKGVERTFRHYMKKRGRWNGGTRHNDRAKVLNHYGYDAVRVEGLPRMMVEKVAAKLDRNKKYIVRTGGHAMALVDGKLVDQGGTFDYTDARRRRKIVNEVHEIVETGEEANTVIEDEPEETTTSEYKYAVYVGDILYKKYKRWPNRKTIRKLMENTHFKVKIVGIY